MEGQVTVRLPSELVERLDQLAEERGVRRSQLIRDAIRAFLDRPPGVPGEIPFDRVRDLKGAVYGGPPDLGARHRDYLKDLFLGR
ncbi:MAG: ribbon-helix-helix protein, CopG family [Gemmatimonadota bacterium]|nr:MAG: ribbon-helix-helix protein, CopG family [Gemmatimonadota bacterium]